MWLLPKDAGMTILVYEQIAAWLNLLLLIVGKNNLIINGHYDPCSLVGWQWWKMKRIRSREHWIYAKKFRAIEKNFPVFSLVKCRQFTSCTSQHLDCLHLYHIFQCCCLHFRRLANGKTVLAMSWYKPFIYSKAVWISPGADIPNAIAQVKTAVHLENWPKCWPWST